MRHLKLTIAVSISIALTVAALSALLAARLHFGIRDGCIICKENPHTDNSTLRETNSNVMLMVMITVSTIVAATVMLPEKIESLFGSQAVQSAARNTSCDC